MTSSNVRRGTIDSTARRPPIPNNREMEIGDTRSTLSRVPCTNQTGPDKIKSAGQSPPIHLQLTISTHFFLLQSAMFKQRTNLWRPTVELLKQNFRILRASS